MNLWGVRNFDVSRDGGFMVYMAATTPSPMLHHRSLRGDEVRPIRGTEGVHARPWLSPDGSRVAFVAEGQLRIVPVEGGPPSTVARISDAHGGDWTDDGLIVFVDDDGRTIRWIDPETGPRRDLLVDYCYNPHVLEGGEEVLCGGGAINTAYVRAFDEPLRDHYFRGEDARDGVFSGVAGSNFRLIDDAYLRGRGVRGGGRGRSGSGSRRRGRRPRPLRLQSRRPPVRLGRGGRREPGAAALRSRHGRVPRAGSGLQGRPAALESRRLASGVVWRISGSPMSGTRDSSSSNRTLRAVPACSWEARPSVRGCTCGGTSTTGRCCWARPTPTCLPSSSTPRPKTPSSSLWTSAPPSSRSARTGAGWSISPPGTPGVRLDPWPARDRSFEVEAQGGEPRWRSNSELVYYSIGEVVRFYRVRLNPERTPPFDDPVLWKADALFADTDGPSYAISPAGDLVYKRSPPDNVGHYVRVVPHWVAEMKRAVDEANQ